MSFQLYVQCFANGSASGFSRDELRQAFSGSLTELEDDYWQIDFGPNGRSDLFLSLLADGSQRIHSISIDHPFNDDRLWYSIWVLLAAPGTIFYFPGSVSALSRDPAAGSALPADMLQVFGQPMIISSFKAIVQSVEAA